MLAFLESLKQVFAWRSMVWWRNIKVLNMLVDPDNHTSWKHGDGTKEEASGINSLLSWQRRRLDGQKN